MNVSKNSSLFQSNNAFKIKNVFEQANKGINQKNSTKDLLSQISNKIVAKQQGSEEVDATAKTQLLNMDSYVNTDSSKNLEEMPEEVLEYYFHVSKLYANVSSKQEQDLQAFKERLQGMDQTIQEYQDIIDGKLALPDKFNIDDITGSLTEAKQNREQFLKDGVEHLNKWVDYGMTSGTFDKHLKKVLGENKFSGTDGSNWQINVASSDIYAEIDRVLEATQGVTEELNRGTQHIYGILEERGFGDKYKKYLEARSTERTSVFDDTEAKSIQQMMLNNLKSAPLHEVEKSD